MIRHKFYIDQVKNVWNSNLWLRNYLFAIFVIITTLAVFIPLKPNMPQSGIDQSWMFAMNEAVAKNLQIGKDIIFTFGPYASIYSQSYHPASDNLMVYGSLFLGLCYALTFLYLGRKRVGRTVVYFIFMACYYFSRDVLFYTYPLILAAGTVIFIQDSREKKNPILNIWQIGLILIAIAPIGMLPLIKGSHILAYLTAVAISLYLFYNRHFKAALIALIGPIIFTVIFWVISGQAIQTLPDYFRNMVPVISGYTEAMAVQGSIIQTSAYLFAAAILILALLFTSDIQRPEKFFLGVCCLLFLFFVFKLGVVRPGGPRAVLGPSIVFAAVILGFIFRNKILNGLLYMVIIVLIFNAVRIDQDLRKELQSALRHSSVETNKEYKDFVFVANGIIGSFTRIICTNVRNTYANIWDGLVYRLLERKHFQSSFDQSLSVIKKEYSLPVLDGTTDIYSYGQSFLLATKNTWNPRPIIQSYSAYTKELAQINEHHIRATKAPDNILFCLQTIDERFPALDDGLSWPALFDNYSLTKIDNELAFFQKKHTIKAASSFDRINSGIYKTGEVVPLPKTRIPIFAEIDLKMTLLGKLLSIVFKPSQLNLTLNLKDGKSVNYRVLSNMMQCGFFISPLVQNTKEFVFLATGNQDYLSNSVVESLIIKPTFGSNLIWEKTYSIKLKGYKGDAQIIKTDL